MLNLEFIRTHPALVQAGLRKRRDSQQIDEIVRLAEQRRELSTRRDAVYAALKPLKASVRAAASDRRADLNAQIKTKSHDAQHIEQHILNIETRLQPLLFRLPNLPHESVRDGGEEQVDDEVWRWGEPAEYDFQPRPHWELGKDLGILDAKSGAKIAGSRFVTLKGAGARMERALISFMLDVHTQQHGYTEILPPLLAKPAVMESAGQLPKFAEQAYFLPKDALYLNPTAEVPLVGLYSDSILPQDALPLRYVAWTTAFRREVGSASRQSRGLLRLHQFNKVELFQIVEPQASYAALDAMIGQAEAILRLLELPYRVVALCAANLPFAAAKTIDLEVWMPGQDRFVEISSISNCEAFQARRAQIRYRGQHARHADYVHTLNGSGLAVGRTMAAILETYQQADGTLVIPKVLRPYMQMELVQRS
jgi:seryl-tRNA synthetase